MKILVIDQDQSTLEQIRGIYAAQGNSIFSANDAREAIWTIKRESPDLIIVNATVSEINGWQICKTLREFSAAPLLVMSALDGSSNIVSALESGADEYLVKPISDEELGANINKMLRRRYRPNFLPLNSLGIQPAVK